MDLNARFYPETAIDHFSLVDGTVGFYLKVKALYNEAAPPVVLDYGAGRGGWFLDDPCRTRKTLRDLRIGAKQVVAADIDAAVLTNVCSDQQVVIDSVKPLPFDDDSFDIIVADYVFEHISDPKFTASELLRVLKPRGWICARTTNRRSYVALAARLTPNRLHRAVLRCIQPERKRVDIFPTTYSLSTLSSVRKHFRGHRVVGTAICSEPSYHFNSLWAYRFFLMLHKFLPKSLGPSLVVFIEK